MTLKHQEQLDSIEDCPLKNESGEKKLYRIVDNPITNKSFIPYGISQKHKYKNDCISLGLSTLTDLKTAKQYLKSFTEKLKEKKSHKAIACAQISDIDGVKHQSGSEESHYSFYPKNDLDLTNMFTIVYDENK